MIALPFVAMGLQWAAAASQSEAQRAAGVAQSRILNWNASALEGQADDALARGTVMAGREKTRGGIVAGESTAQAGGSGVDVASESIVDLAGKTAGTAALDAETVRANALREALGLRTQAAGTRLQARLVKEAAIDSANATMLGGTAGMLSTGYNMGMFPKFGK